MPDWVEIMIALIGGGGIASLAPTVAEYFRSRGQQATTLEQAKIADLAQWRQELVNRVSEQEGRIETLRGQIDEWQEKYRDVSVQNTILKQQVKALEEENENLKKMVAALEDENQSLQQRLEEIER